MKCSICINTYKRPGLLKKLLDSLNDQILDENITSEIIVVDNDKSKSGQKVVDEVAIKIKFPIKYFIQPIKNISLTRNKAVSEAAGEYIFFIDDDEYADRSWISNSLNCLVKYNADAVFGVVLSYFDEDTPEWIKNNHMYHRQSQKTGTVPKFTRTGNCVIRSSILKTIEGPFDPNYGLTGGSDTHLFTTLARNGAKYVSCEESVVYEYTPPERANLRWLMKRSLRTGNSFARRYLEIARNKLVTMIYLTFKALTLGIFSLVMMCIQSFSKMKRNYWLIKACGYYGHILAVLGIHYVEYK